MHINFQQKIGLVDHAVKTVHTDLFSKICNFMQLEFRKIMPFGQALPPN